MGRSRTWLDDRGWWVGVVELQPSSWSKGSYLNVGAMWLWHEGEHHIRYDVGHRVAEAGFACYESEEQFTPEAQRLTRIAREEIERLRAMLPNLAAAISLLSDNGSDRQGWPAYNLGVALGLAGRRVEATACLRALRAAPEDSPWWSNAVRRAHELAGLIERDPDRFFAEIQNAIIAFRNALKLEPAINGQYLLPSPPRPDPAPR